VKNIHKEFNLHTLVIEHLKRAQLTHTEEEYLKRAQLTHTDKSNQKIAELTRSAY
jgi:hypothetical protein